jgi:isocitrate/isopropylmalate dehydrogenase
MKTHTVTLIPGDGVGQHVTFDLGGTATTSEFAQAIIERL